MNVPGPAAATNVLVGVDADAQWQAFERIGPTRRDGDVGEITVAVSVFRQTQALVWLGIVGAQIDIGEHVLLAPLSRLNN